jgi:hypothetical protein
MYEVAAETVKSKGNQAVYKEAQKMARQLANKRLKAFQLKQASAK